MTDKLTRKELLAAEYVLGTLNHAERQQVMKSRTLDLELDRLISEWQQRLSPLSDTIDGIPPREGLLRDIQQRLPKQPIDSHSYNDEVVTLRKQMQRWKNTAIATTALAAGLAAFVLFIPPATSINEPFVAVFQQDDQQPAFLMSVNLQTQQLTIRPISIEGRVGKSYQLWIKAEALGDKPRSLGLLGSLDEPTFKKVEFNSSVLKKAIFGISVEPEGGSPTGQPTGPAIHGQLYATSI